jgi:hypothetical protein
MNLSIGILIIGSLYWDTRGGRDRWRESRLQMDRDFLVKAPIRYGRRSTTGTYTMVFGSVPTLGQARVVPCKKSMNAIKDLIEEGEWLWAAERREVPRGEQQLDHKLSATWGCVALLISPNANMHRSWRDCWAKRVSAERNETVVGRHLVDGRGLLQVSWPELAQSGDSAPLDLLLATTNSPTLTNDSYPSAHEIADAWNRDVRGGAEYFRENRRSGIYTFEDESIAGRLRPETRPRF